MTPEVGIVCRFQRQRRKAQRLEFAFHPVVGCLDAEESLCAAAAVYQGGAHPWYLAVGSGHSTLIKVSSIRSGGIGNRSITRASVLSTPWVLLPIEEYLQTSFPREHRYSSNPQHHPSSPLARHPSSGSSSLRSVEERERESVCRV